MFNLKLLHDKQTLNKIKQLALPSIIEQALATVVMYVDTAMVGSIGANASAAVGLTSTFNWLVNSPLWAFGIGFLAVISQALGAKDSKRAKDASMHALYASIVLGIGLMIITLAITPYLPAWLGAKEEIQREASLYFGIICAPMVFRSISILFGAVLRASGDMRTPMVVNGAVNILNIILNYFLIGSTFVWKMGTHSITIHRLGLGVAGAAIATAISMTIGGVWILWAYFKNEELSCWGQKLYYDKPLMKSILDISLPVTLERVAHCSGQVVFTSLVAKLGTIAIAAHTIALTAEEAFYIPGYGMQAAASTLAGNAVGERDRRKLMQTSQMIMLLACLAMSVMGAILFIFAPAIMGLFTPDTEVIRQGASVLRIVAISEPIFGILIILEGVFNGVGDTKAPFFISTFTMWGIRLLFTYVAITYFNLGLNAVWICMVLDNVVRCSILSLRFYSEGWRTHFVKE